MDVDHASLQTTPVSCGVSLDVLSAYFDGELPRDAQEPLASHVCHCLRCAGVLADYAAIRRILRMPTSQMCASRPHGRR